MIKKLVFPVLLLPIIFLITGCSNTYRVKTSTGGSFTAEEEDVICKKTYFKTKRKDLTPITTKLYLGSGNKGGFYKPVEKGLATEKLPDNYPKANPSITYDCEAFGLLRESTGRSRYILVETEDCISNPNRIACSAGRFFNLLDWYLEIEGGNI